MNILFLTFGFPGINDHHMYPALLKEFINNGHIVYVLSGSEKITCFENDNSYEKKLHIIEIKVGKIQKTNIVTKGINMLLLDYKFKKTIKKSLRNVKFDFVLYHTPPITFADTIDYIKKRDHAKSYLMLKDIFPQNAVDIGILSKCGIKGMIYNYFRRKEKKLYERSDCIGCMSPANVEYLLRHNPEIPVEKVAICPNSVKVRDLSLNAREKILMREKYDLPMDRMIFVYGGNIGKPQGIPFIIECLKSQIDNSNVFFLIVGSGTEYGKIEKFFSQNKVSNMKLMKSLPKDDYDRMIAACDVGMIFLDHRFTIPNFPSRLLSYMQAKLPVLACTDPNTDIGKVITEGRFGWWCESNNVQVFDKLIQNIETADLKVLGQNGIEYLKRNYSVCNTYKTIIDDYFRSSK